MSGEDGERRRRRNMERKMMRKKGERRKTGPEIRKTLHVAVTTAWCYFLISDEQQCVRTPKENV